MIELNSKVGIEVEVGTFATLLAGLYCTYSQIDPVAIPTSVYIELSEKLIPFLEKWDYTRISLEDWIKYNLIIMPKDFFSEEELEEFKGNDIFFERVNGRVILIVTAMV